MQEGGDIAHFRVGPPRVGFEFDAVFTPEGAHHVLAADARRYAKDAPVWDEFRWSFGNGLLASNGERWRRHRRILAPVFRPREVASHLPGVEASARDLVSWCEEEMGADGQVDLHAVSMRYGLQALGTAIFGEDITTAGPEMRASLPVLARHAARRGLAPARTPRWWPSRSNREAERHRRRLRATADELIRRRQADADPGEDLLGLLLKAHDPETGQGLDPADVRDEALMFLIAGHETTGSSLALTLHLVGRHPVVQDRIRSEVDSAATAGASDLLDPARLPYTTQVVHESLRLYPPGHTIVRRATEETEVSGCPIADHGIVAVSVWGIHRRSDLWTEPERFSPERFADGQSATTGGPEVRYRHLPFGGGPRSCIGEHLALAELVLAIAAVVGRFEVEAVSEEPDVEVDLTLRPKGVLPARLHPLASGT